MRILGVDPGYDRLGVSIISDDEKKGKLIFSSCIVTVRDSNYHDRLKFIGEELLKIITLYKPNSLAIEKVYFYNNKKTAILVSEVKGVVSYICAANGLSIREFSPLEVKSTITGYGKASKEQVSNMVKRIVLIKDEPKLDDEYDAIAIALTSLYSSINTLSTGLEQ